MARRDSFEERLTAPGEIMIAYLRETSEQRINFHRLRQRMSLHRLCCMPSAAAAFLAASGSATPVHGPALPAWVMAAEAKQGLRELWTESVAAHRERVACLAGIIAPDTVHVARIRILEIDSADSVTAPAERSLQDCGAPEWMGTVHTHVQSLDDPAPAPRFSPGDRTVMSAWADRWTRQGAFCVLYSERAAHCEVYPIHQQHE
jgi:hypothetical protein